jgi:peptidoglycan biosynthesis protein MviN/MurJ (putative lipid II flippase)
VKDVGWGDVIFSSVIVAVVVGIAVVISYFLFSSHTSQGEVLGVGVINVTVMATCLVGSLLTVLTYQGPKTDFGQLWAWLLLMFCFPAIGIVLVLLGGFDHESVTAMVSWLMLQISVLTFVVTMSVRMNGRDSAITVEEASAKDY